MRKGNTLILHGFLSLLRRSCILSPPEILQNPLVILLQGPYSERYEETAALARPDPGIRECPRPCRSEEHTSELQSLMRISYAVFCLKNKNKNSTTINIQKKTETA